MSIQLPTYASQSEKSAFFNIIEINNIDDFDNMYDIHIESKGLYRGINDASYKIYSSLQRAIITSELAGTFNIDDYTKNASDTSILRKYFESIGVIPSKISIFSFLQHYGAPTPMLDFTTNFKTALYFALEKYLSNSFTETKSLSDYFSVYFIADADRETIAIPDVIESLKKIKETTIASIAHYPDYTIDIVTDQIDRFLEMNTCNVFLIENNESFREIYNAYNNIRIVAQEGLFIYNSYHDTPLEAALRIFFEQYTHYQPDYNDIDDEFTAEREQEYVEGLEKVRRYHNRLSQNIITSYDIHKSLFPDILRKLAFNKEVIYPDPILLSRQIFESSIKIK